MLNTFKLNYKKAPVNPKDYTIKVAPAILKAVKSATSVDLSPDCTNIKNQGAIGSCTAFATVGLMEYNLKKHDIALSDDIYSERFTYYVTRVDIMGWTTEDTGAYVSDSLHSTVAYGCCPENLFPYNGDHVQKPPQSCYDNALKNQSIKYAKIPEENPQLALDEARALLSEGYCFAGGFVCFDNLWDPSTNSTGVILPPNNTPIGGHAVLFVGYDNEKKLFKFKNSWGAGWGDNGYGYLPYEYLLTGNLWDLWTVFQQENNDDNAIIGYERGSQTEPESKELNIKFDIFVTVKKNSEFTSSELQYAKEMKGFKNPYENILVFDKTCKDKVYKYFSDYL